MIQGTASHAGKSTLVAALCRIFAQDGYRVAPFKAQNMSLNAAVTADGGEIGRAQYVQAEAAGVAPTVRMNPILLKPTDDERSQIIVLGRALRSAPSSERATDYYTRKAELWPVVTESIDGLRAEHDVVVIEGAGSPAEINLTAHDIVNMRVACYADAPVLLVGDIERGGVFAALYGTVMLLRPEERARVRGFIINKFRGDETLLTPGLGLLESHTGIPTLGVLPYVAELGLAEEDSLGLPDGSPQAAIPDGAVIDIAVIAFPHLSNFDEFDGLRREPAVRLRYIRAAAEVGTPDLIVLPGTKTTVADLCWLQGEGLDAVILERRRAGTPVIGICGGFQMLGHRIRDPEHVESPHAEMRGLALLPIETTFDATKVTRQVRVRVVCERGLLACAGGLEATGYEIHAGRVRVVDDGPESVGRPAPVLTVTARTAPATPEPEGAVDPEGRTLGTSVHGLFEDPLFRRAVLSALAESKGTRLETMSAPVTRDAAYDALADVVRRHVDLDAVYRLTGLRS